MKLNGRFALRCAAVPCLARLSGKGKAGAAFGRRINKARAGMTLIEVILSFGILAVALITGIGSIMQHTVRNRQLAMEVASLQAINKVVSELEDLADASPSDKTMAFTVVDHFKGMASDMVPMGPKKTSIPRVEDDAANGCLIYRFWVPSPGESQYLETSPKFVPNHMALGEMRIHLNERILNNDILPRFTWTDLSGSPASYEEGVDLNLNGRKDENLLTNYDSVKQLAITFDVTFFNNEAHDGMVFNATRDILLSRIRDSAKNVDPVSP